MYSKMVVVTFFSISKINVFPSSHFSEVKNAFKVSSYNDCGLARSALANDESADNTKSNGLIQTLGKCIHYMLIQIYNVTEFIQVQKLIHYILVFYHKQHVVNDHFKGCAYIQISSY